MALAVFKDADIAMAFCNSVDLTGGELEPYTCSEPLNFIPGAPAIVDTTVAPWSDFYAQYPDSFAQLTTGTESGSSSGPTVEQVTEGLFFGFALMLPLMAVAFGGRQILKFLKQG